MTYEGRGMANIAIDVLIKRTSRESVRHCSRVRHPNFPIMSRWNNPQVHTGLLVSEHSQFYGCHPWCGGPILEQHLTIVLYAFPLKVMCLSFPLKNPKDLFAVMVILLTWVFLDKSFAMSTPRYSVISTLHSQVFHHVGCIW